MLQIAKIILVERQGIAQDCGGILDRIALRQPGLNRFCHEKAAGCDQGDQQGDETLMGHGEARCCLDFGTAV